MRITEAYNMNGNTLILGIQLIVLGLAFIFGKFILPNLSQQSITNISQALIVINQFAASFVTWAKQFMPNNTGDEKMSAVIEKLTAVCEKYKINMSEDELKAIAQKAYSTMKAQEQAAEVNKVAATGIVPAKMVESTLKDKNGALLNVSSGQSEKSIQIPSGVTVNVVENQSSAQVNSDSNSITIS